MQEMGFIRMNDLDMIPKHYRPHMSLTICSCADG
jgi:hypothetical protein